MKNIIFWLGVAMILILVCVQSLIAFIGIWFDEWAEASSKYEASEEPYKDRFDDFYKNN